MSGWQGRPEIRVGSYVCSVAVALAVSGVGGLVRASEPEALPGDVVSEASHPFLDGHAEIARETTLTDESADPDAPPSSTATEVAPALGDAQATDAGDERETESGETEPMVRVPFNIGLWYPVSLNGHHRGQRVRNIISLGLFASRATRVDGVTVALGVTSIDEIGHGVGLAFIGNINRGVQRGAQMSYVFNHAQRMEGVQWSSLVNHASELRGAQVGLVNVAGLTKGAQWGLVNVAGDVRGVQIGLINVAQQADASIALLPLTKEGNVHPEVWTSDTAMINVGVRFPARYTYGFLSVGLHPVGRNVDNEADERVGQGWEFGGGFGGHIPIGPVFIDMDLGTYGVVNGVRSVGKVAPLLRSRLMLGYSIVPRFTVFGGPTLNALFDDADDRVHRPGYGWVSRTEYEGDIRIRVWPGFVAGLRF